MVCRLKPVTQEGFEAGDFENFALAYIGDSQQWVRHKARISDRDAISGTYSLCWDHDTAQEPWIMISNAFHAERAYEVSLRFRITAADCELALLGAVEKYSKGTTPRYAAVDALVVSQDSVSLQIGARAPQWSTDRPAVKEVIEPNKVYTLTMRYGSDETVWAEVFDEQNHTLARFEGQSQTPANGIGLYVRGAQDGQLIFDDFRVESQHYRVRAGQWVRSPQFVVFKRPPEAGHDQGEWVGAASIVHEEDTYKLWYRIRHAGIRGVGYGYATSKDLFNWQRHPDNPVFKIDKTKLASSERICVLKIDGQYKAWYATDVRTTWHIAHATSPDGIHWDDHGNILTDTFYKDPEVVYVNGTYYMYAIHPTTDEISVLTSDDGIKWQFRAKIEAPCHVHVGAYYVEDTQEFKLYEDAVDKIPYMRVATSKDGIRFGSFEPVLANAEVGLDDTSIGVNYPVFLRDGYGHLETDRDIIMIYQARHDYFNNRPSWNYAGDGKLVMAGKFEGFKLGVTANIEPNGGLYYHSFPLDCGTADGFAVKGDIPLEVTITSWNPKDKNVGRWTIESPQANVNYTFSNLTADTQYILQADDQTLTATSDPNGTLQITAQNEGRKQCRLQQAAKP